MKNKSIIDSWNKTDPDSAAQEHMLENIISRSGEKRMIMHWKPLTAVAAACVILLAGVFVFNRIDTPDQLPDSVSSGKNSNLANQNPESEAGIADLSDEIKGLPVKNFKLSEIELNIAMDRIAFSNFLNFFEYGTSSFVIVKVADTQPVPATGDDMSEKQTSAVKILETVWGDDVPKAIDVTQYLYGGCTGDEATNLLREGGVYLLPLENYKGEYYLNGDLDVLFEIDDQGRIWSHSDYPDFNRYDGEDYQAVTKEIMRISQDDALILATSSFGMAMRGWQLLEVTITSDPEEEKDEYGYIEVVYAARVESTLSGDDPGTKILLHSNTNEDVPLSSGKRYLLFVDNYDGKHYMNPNMLASVEADGTIKNLGGEGSTFAEYNSYTVEEVSKLAHEVTEFLKTFQQ
ncbi:hypothetical protein [Anaerocolumna xylanovorans]|uniref:Uncharacterized protein n=1 Tax=Anaerocolumna xylanovorans DSM 12503 TaxID=1121345 RepID=A0A1M7Y6S3_9FIRM|nr:hypothetical protein [Anaerocolumna xylanovorans]SHO48343.1 hypothetical protein SAMN02745217_01782 [Anaerocolumna xylanovorans DSM 12503]